MVNSDKVGVENAVALFSYAVMRARQWRNAEGAWTWLRTSLSMAAEILSAESFLRVVNRCEPRCEWLIALSQVPC